MQLFTDDDRALGFFQFCLLIFKGG